MARSIPADITPGVDTLYRVWLKGRLVCACNSGSLAMWALLEAKRFAARAFPANDTDPDTTPPAMAMAAPAEQVAA